MTSQLLLQSKSEFSHTAFDRVHNFRQLLDESNEFGQM